MPRVQSSALVASLIAASVFSLPALAGAPMDLAGGVAPVQEAPQPAPVRVAQVRGNMGGGLIEAIFGSASASAAPQGGAIYAPRYASAPAYPYEQEREQYATRGMDPRYEKQEVAYAGKERPGTIVVDTPHHFLFLVEEGGKALRYGIGVGRPGFSWSGVKTVSMKREWPDWRPPADMLRRRPDLPRYMPGGPENPLGARALYLGSSLYRIHGSNEPWTIGTNVSSGCIRMRNEDVIDLYRRVSVGTKVVVL
jgi:lipoprotein-anchoring transpeptidase ErfK/SrfK